MMSFIYWPTRDSICLPDAEATFEALSRHVILGVGTKNQQAGNKKIAAAEGSELQYVFWAYLFLILYVNTPVCFSLSIFPGIDSQHHIFIENIVSKRYLFNLYLKNALFRFLKYCVVVEL